MNLTFHSYCSIRPPILQASSVWLTYGRGFENVQNEEVKDDGDNVDGSSGLGLGQGNAVPNKTPDVINTDRFHLVKFTLETFYGPKLDFVH